MVTGYGATKALRFARLVEVSVRLDNLPMRALLGVGTGGPPPDNAGVLTYECDLRSQDAARQSRPMYRAFRGAAAEAASHRTASGG